MGMSSSQARLLNLTARMHQIEYKAAKLEAQKLQMANESSKVYDDYLLALDKTKIQVKTLNTDGSTTYTDVTYQELINRGYQIKVDGEDRISISASTEANYKNCGDNRDYFIALENNRLDANGKASDGVYEIYSADQLASISFKANQTYRLMSDIDMSGVEYTSKSLNNGATFDGNGHSITGLKSSLFNVINNATVKNLNLNVNINSSNSVAGALACQTNSGDVNIENVNVSGNITTSGSNSTTYIGGLIGANSANLNISGVTSKVNITKQDGSDTSTFDIGGIVGRSTGSINMSNSVYNGTITDNFGKSIIGGLTGEVIGSTSSTNTITNCASYGTITSVSNTASNYAGGLFGKISGTSDNLISISNCRTEMNITSGSACGVTVEGSYLDISNVYVGGTLNSKATTNNSGIIGKNGSASSISNCIVASKMTRTSDDMTNAGSIIGNCSASSGSETTVDKVTVTSTITGPSGEANVGRIVNSNGNTPNKVTETNTNGADSSVYSAGKTATGASTSEQTPLTDTQNAGSTFDAIKKYGYILDTDDDNPIIGHENDTTWFTNMVNAGRIQIFKPDSSSGVFEVSVSTDTNLQEVSDTSLLKKAEAQYEADMRKIDAKDTKYDTDLAALETERTAIKDEMETLKTIAKDNVERTFKLFS